MTDRHTTPSAGSRRPSPGSSASARSPACAALATSPEPTKLASSGSFYRNRLLRHRCRGGNREQLPRDAVQRAQPGGLEFWLTIQAEDVFTNLATGQKATFRSKPGRSAGGSCTMAIRRRRRCRSRSTPACVRSS